MEFVNNAALSVLIFGFCAACSQAGPMFDSANHVFLNKLIIKEL